MILSFLLLICGYIRYSVTPDNYENVIVSLFDHGLVPIRQKKKKNIAYFDFYRKNSNEVCKAVSSVCEYTKKERGINTFLRKFKRRYGLVLGLVIIAASVFVSKMFIWNINIEGLNTVSEQRALRILEENGIYVGCYIPKLELHEIYNDILIAYDEFCWISVNIRGTVANIEVREAYYPQEKNNEGKCANLIAKYDSEIVSIKTYKGRDTVKVGDAVRSGELLVSGLYEDKTGRLNYCYSQGEVFGRVEREFSVEIPLKYERLVYTGEKTRDFSVKIFSKTINIVNSSRKDDIVYDIIERNEQLTLLDKIVLPMSYTEKTYYVCSVLKSNREQSAANRIAHEKIGRDILSFVGNGEIVSKEYSSTIEDETYKLSVVLTANVDIAQVQEFKVNKG